MTMTLPLTPLVSRTEPGQPYHRLEYVFDHVPSLRELLPQFRGLPGFEYFQCAVQNLRRAQDEGWIEVERTVIYTIAGPLGRQDMKLLARGKRIPGQPHDSGARLCICDRTVETVTGVWINPNRHLPGIEPTQTALTPNSVDQTAPQGPERNQSPPKPRFTGTAKGVKDVP